MAEFKNIGQYSIYLTGSKATIKRVVKTDGKKYFITWYGNQIEVKRGTSGFYTVGTY